jgi:hypothetical protein
MTPPTIEEAVALYIGVPSLLSLDGDAGMRTRAGSVSIQRTHPESDEFDIEYTQYQIVTFSSGRKEYPTLPPIRGLKGSELATQVVTIDGKEWPVALAMAILAAVYVREASPVASQNP